MDNEQKPNWYDKNYKRLLIIPAVMLILALIFLLIFYQNHNDFVYKDVSLTGGTSVTVFDSEASSKELKLALEEQFPDLRARSLSDIRTGKQIGINLETQQEVDAITSAIEQQLGYKLTTENSSIEFSGSSLSKNFYEQLISSIAVAFLLMGIVVFVIFGTSKKIKLLSVMITSVAVSMLFSNVPLMSSLAILTFVTATFLLLFTRKEFAKKRIDTPFLLTFIIGILLINNSLITKIIPGFESIKYATVAIISIILLYIYAKNSIPSIAIILAAFTDIILTVAIVDIIGMPLSSAGLVAFLMLIGYSVDTDILLTTRVIKDHEGPLNTRIYQAFKTGMTMTLTAIAAVGVSLIIIYSFSNTLRQIFSILLIGLTMDLISTWITNASIIKWYMESKQ